MFDNPDLKVTTQVLWTGAAILALIDCVFVPLLAGRVSTEAFRRLKWPLLAATTVFWIAIWLVLGAILFWKTVYSYVFPEWARWYIPPAQGVLFGVIGLLAWWLALRLPGRAVLNWCLLGGLWGMITHGWAVFRGIMDKPPLLQGVSKVAAVVLAGFEFTFYWCVILVLGLLFQRIGGAAGRPRGAADV